MPFKNIPTDLTHTEEGRKRWLNIIRDAQNLASQDKVLQTKCSKGLFLKGRRLPIEVMGRFYCQYVTLLNRLYEAYTENMQIQREKYIREFIEVIVSRMFEIREEIVHYLVTDYIYVDGSLIQLQKTPVDIEIVLPYAYSTEIRPASIESLLQRMWSESEWRKRHPPKPPKVKKAREAGLTVAGFDDGDDILMGIGDVADDDEEDDDVSATPVPSEHTIVTQELIYAIMIQQHERFRQTYMQIFIAKCRQRRRYLAKAVEIPKRVRTAAAALIQLAYREFMKYKRKRIKDVKRDVILGMIADPFRDKLDYREEARKLAKLRQTKRQKILECYKNDLERENTRLLVMRKEDQIDDITEDVREWLRHWYYGYGFFPSYPYEVEGGTLLVVRGDFPTIEEQMEEDEKRQASTKGKTKEQLKAEKQREKMEEEMKAELLREQRRKEAENLFKMRSNPLGDPGYAVMASDLDILEVIQKYQASWKMYDMFPCVHTADAVYGYLMTILDEEIMSQMHKDCRKYVDELMRLDLKLLIKAQQTMFSRMKWKWPKMKPKPPPKIAPIYEPIQVTDEILLQIEPLFDLGIISKPTVKLCDVYGDTSYGNYEAYIKDPDVKFRPPGYGDVKSRLLCSCALGCGREAGGGRTAVMLLGQPRHGKGFLVDAVAGEMNATKIDISPEVFSSKTNKAKRLMSKVLLAAKVFQPTVIFCKNVERVFYKKVPREERYLKPKKIASALKKIVKQVAKLDKIIFICTCSDPWVAQAKNMVSIFDEIILVPRLDYGSVRNFLYESLQRIRSMPRDYWVQPIAHFLQGYGFADIMRLYHRVMDSERIVRLNVTPLRPIEFLEQFIEEDVDPISEEDYAKLELFWLSHSPLLAERQQYTEINLSRARVYEKAALEAAKKGQEFEMPS